jgi:hypothetical protein
MTKETLTAKVSPKTMDRLEDYADREGISKSESTDRLLKQGLDVEESDMRLIPVGTDGGKIIEDKLEKTESELESTQSEIENLSTEIEKLKSAVSSMSLPLMAGLLWIGTDLTVGIPGGSPGVVVSGLAVIVWLLVAYYGVVFDD